MGTINVCLERKGEGDCGVKPVFGICLVEVTGISTGRVEPFLVDGLLWLDGNCW